MEVIQDDYLKEICSRGRYGLNPGRLQLDRPIHCWSFSWVPWLLRSKLEGVATLIADPPYANSATDTDTHLLSGVGNTMSTLSILLYQQVQEKEEADK